VTVEGLIIRVNNNVGEADRIVTVLTAELGVVRASVRGARKVKSRMAAATALLSYSRLSLVSGRDIYIVDDVEPIRIFSGLSSDIISLTLAQYFCELAGVLAPKDELAHEFLRLVLNALYFLSREDGVRHVDCRIVKAVVELRLLTLAGFMPDLDACRICGAHDGDIMRLLVRDGMLVCGDCASDAMAGINLSPAVLSAMKFVVSVPVRRCFSFSLADECIPLLERACEGYALAQLGRGFHTLDVYRSLGNQ